MGIKCNTKKVGIILKCDSRKARWVCWKGRTAGGFGEENGIETIINFKKDIVK